MNELLADFPLLQDGEKNLIEMDHCYQAICRISFSSALHAELFDQLFEFFNIEKKSIPNISLILLPVFLEKNPTFHAEKRTWFSLL